MGVVLRDCLNFGLFESCGFLGWVTCLMLPVELACGGWVYC